MTQPVIFDNMKNIGHCQMALMLLYNEIERHQGEEKTRRLFAQYAPRTKSNATFKRHLDVAIQFYRMPKAKRSAAKLADRTRNRKRNAAAKETLGERHHRLIYNETVHRART